MSGWYRSYQLIRDNLTCSEEYLGLKMLNDKRVVRRIGQKALTFRFPAVIDGEVSYVGPEEFLGQWLFLSFVQTFEKSDSLLWNRQGKELAKLGAALLIVPSETQIGNRRPSAALLRHPLFE